jgi:hypothetical protein
LGVGCEFPSNAIAQTFASIGVVALIVAIQTFLSFTLEVELTDRWPWQPRPSPGPLDIRSGGEPARVAGPT